MKSTVLSRRLAPSGASTRVRLPWLLASAGVAMLALGLTIRQDAVARQAVDLGLPPPMMLVSLLALVALAFGILAWPASRRTGAAPRRPTSTVDWQRLSQMANWFFDAHGLVRDKASRSWAPGASLMLHNGSHRFLVQTKQWRARQVDAAAVQRLSRELARRKIDRGVMLCAGDVFTPAARQLARRSGILLLDPSQLHSRSGAVRSAAAPRAPVPEPVEAPVAMPAAAAAADEVRVHAHRADEPGRAGGGEGAGAAPRPRSSRRLARVHADRAQSAQSDRRAEHLSACEQTFRPRPRRPNVPALGCKSSPWPLLRPWLAPPQCTNPIVRCFRAAPGIRRPRSWWPGCPPAA